MKLRKFLFLVVACGVIPFGTAQLLYQSTIEPFQALLYQSVVGVLCGCVAMMRICDDDYEHLKPIAGFLKAWKEERKSHE
jgi:hypothetical protein